MRALLILGILLIVLGIVSLFVGIPHQQSSGLEVGGAKIGVQTRTSERIPLPASIAIIVGGVVLAAVGGRSSH
jgi:ABC-type enterochelin transport system permease subunit